MTKGSVSLLTPTGNQNHNTFTIMLTVNQSIVGLLFALVTLTIINTTNVASASKTTATAVSGTEANQILTRHNQLRADVVGRERAANMIMMTYSKSIANAAAEYLEANDCPFAHSTTNLGENISCKYNQCLIQQKPVEIKTTPNILVPTINNSQNLNRCHRCGSVSKTHVLTYSTHLRPLNLSHPAVSANSHVT